MELEDVLIAVGIDIKVINQFVNAEFTDELKVQLATLIGIQASDCVNIRNLTIHAASITAGAGDSFGLQIQGTGLFDQQRKSLRLWIELEAFVDQAEEEPTGKLKSKENGILTIAPSELMGCSENLRSIGDAFFGSNSFDLFKGLMGQLSETAEELAFSFYYAPQGQLEVEQGFVKQNDPLRYGVRGRKTNTTAPALIASIAPKNKTAVIPGGKSMVIEHTGMQIVISRTVMNRRLEENAESQVGKDIQGATIKSLSLEMTDFGFLAKGKASKGDTDIHWKGPVEVSFSKYQVLSDGRIENYGGNFNVSSARVKVDLDYPWYLDLAKILAPALVIASFFIGMPLLAVLTLAVVGGTAITINVAFDDAFDQAEAAPGNVQKSLAQQLAEGLAQSLRSAGGFVEEMETPVTLFNDSSWINNGHMFQSFLLFAGVTNTNVAEIVYDKFRLRDGAHGTSVGFLVLGSGHKLHPSEAGQLLKSRNLVIPGHHGVELKVKLAPQMDLKTGKVVTPIKSVFYVRSNPDSTVENNLVPVEEIVTRA